MGASCSPLALLLLFTILLIQSITAVSDDQNSGSCPVQYSRHSLDDISSKAQVPYLLGGIYDSSRDCPNCNRGGLWADFCSFKALGKSRFWDMQLCNSSTAGAVVDRALKQDNAAELLTMTPCDMWSYMRGRTTWVIGDSMAKDLFRALRCFMVEFQDLSTYTASNNVTAMHFLEALPGKGEPRCAHMLDNTRLCQVHAIEGDLFVAAGRDRDRTSVGGVLPLIQQHLASSSDIFILHFGLWHGETRQQAYRTYLRQLGRYYASTKSSFPHAFFMETPKQHFDSADGDYKVPWITTRKGPWTCQPIQGVTLNPDGTLTADAGNAVAQDVAAGSWRNQHAREILSQYDVPLIPLYNVTVPAWGFHRHNMDGQECSHYCHPSLPQLWLWNVLTTFREQQLPLVENVSLPQQQQQQQQAGCAVVYDWEERRYGTPRPDAAALAVRDRQKSFWKWLSASNNFLSADGLLVPPPVDSNAGNNSSSTSTSSSSDKKSDGAAGGLTAWQLLQKLLDLQLLQHPQQQQTPNQQQQQQQKGAGAPQQLPSPQEAQQQQQQQSSATRRQMPHVQQERAGAEQLEKGSRTKGGSVAPYQQQQRQRQGPGPPQQQLGDLQQQDQGHVLVARLRHKKQQQQQQRRAAAGGPRGGVPAAVHRQAQGG